VRHIKLNATLRGKSRKLWLEGTEFTETETDPLPPDIEFEIGQNRPGVLTITEIEPDAETPEPDAEQSEKVDTVADAETPQADARVILFRKFEKRPVEQVVVPPKKFEGQAPPWFHRQPGAKAKRQMLLRKFA